MGERGGRIGTGKTGIKVRSSREKVEGARKMVEMRDVTVNAGRGGQVFYVDTSHESCPALLPPPRLQLDAKELDESRR
ncbi:hypothetical protein KM043_015512 [Ampulex compressa]|nr:hypothetical protein KM043_015512 [Ampulex compressa]